MSPDLAGGLRALAEALPAGTAVPVPREVLLELLTGNGEAGRPADVPTPDLTVTEVAARFGRKPSTIRGWIASGHLAGAYHFKGRELRIPFAAVLDFEAQQRPVSAPAGDKASRPASGNTVDLGSWRKIAS